MAVLITVRFVKYTSVHFIYLLQISIVSECVISRIGSLEFDFFAGTCGTYMINNDPVIFLCFSKGEQWNGEQCRISIQRSTNSVMTITDFEFETDSYLDSKENHRGTRLANYNGFPLALGGTENAALEMFDPSSNSWVKKTSYPFSREYHQYSVISLSSSVIYFGGRILNEGWIQTKIVAEFKNDDWSEIGEIGEMWHPRSYHSSIMMNQKIFILGGENRRYRGLFKSYI